jgi:hypothetical protein
MPKTIRGLTLLFCNRDNPRLDGVGVFPHLLPDGAVHAIGTENHIPLFDGPICKMHIHVRFMLCDLSYFLIHENLGFIR